MVQTYNQDTYGRIIGKLVTGCSYGKQVSPQDKHLVSEKYGDIVNRIQSRLPRKYYIRIGSVLVKASLVYRTDKVDEFCDCIRDEIFHGKNDPAHLLWVHLIRDRDNKDAAAFWTDTYKKTVTAVRAFCEGRTLNRLDQSVTDIFSWEKDFTVPQTALKKNTAPVKINPAKMKVAAKASLRLIGSVKKIAEKTQNGLCACGKVSFVILPDGSTQCGECYIGSVTLKGD